MAYYPPPRMPPTQHSDRSFETTMLRGTNVNIRNANMNMINQQNSSTSLDRRFAFELLRSNSSLPALVDANERYDPPRCAEATRRNIVQKIENWVRHDSHHGVSSSIFWLYGGAGAGKSALAQTLAERSRSIGGLAASFFFCKTDVNRNDGNRLVPTLALQLVQSFPGISPFVERRIHSNPDLFKRNCQTQMRELFVQPLTNLWHEETNGVQSDAARKSHPRLVVIDGLDECNDPKTQCDLLQIIAHALPHLPYPLRFLITSRPESHITTEFQHNFANVPRYNLSDDADAAKDIRNFLEDKFAEIRRTHPLRRHLPSQWPPQGSISSIVEQSSSHFIYASTVILFIQSAHHRPDDRLQVILGLKQPNENDRPYARLDSLYRLIFLEVEPVQLEQIHHALGIMHLRSLKNGFFALPQWTSDRHAIEELLDLKPGDLILLFDPLRSLVTFDHDKIRILHKSLFDYLLDPSRSGDLQLNRGLAHETAANQILQRKLQDSWDPAEFRLFAYHCQFARLNDNLAGHLHSLARDPKITFSESLSALLGASKQSCLLQSILYFLQVIGRQDFEAGGRYYRKYVRKKNQWLSSAVPLTLRLKCMMCRLTRFELIRESASLEKNLRWSFENFFKSFDAKGVQLRDLNGWIGRTPIPVVNLNISATKSIKQEHTMFSSYVKARNRYPDIVFSFLNSTTELVHSCHFVIRDVSVVWVAFVMLVTYTKHGVRLSCSEFEFPDRPLHSFSQEDVGRLVENHLQNTQEEVNNGDETVSGSLRMRMWNKDLDLVDHYTATP